MKEGGRPKFKVTKATMNNLFKSGNFFNGCNREEILSDGATYHICKSDNGKLLLLEQVVGNETITLASLPWEKEYDKKTNPWLTMKKTESTTARNYITELDSSTSSKRPKRFQRFGMNEGWMGNSSVAQPLHVLS